MYQSARAFGRSPPASDSAFSDSTGNTQGIRLRIRPPPSASSNASHRLVGVPEARRSASAGGSVRGTSVAAVPVEAAASDAAGVSAADAPAPALSATAAPFAAGSAAGASVLAAASAGGVTLPAGIDSAIRRVIGG